MWTKGPPPDKQKKYLCVIGDDWEDPGVLEYVNEFGVDSWIDRNWREYFEDEITAHLSIPEKPEEFK